jgi:hypothetical protein
MLPLQYSAIFAVKNSCSFVFPLYMNHSMHAEIAGMSSRGQHVKLDEADHYSLLMNRAHAEETVQILGHLIDSVRNTSVTAE